MKRAIILSAAISLATLGLGSCGGSVDGASRASIKNKGSDTLVTVAQAWAEEYSKVGGGTVVSVTGGGSGTGINAMINGTVDIANASRKMKESEFQTARAAGIEPVEHIVGFDALAVYVHKDNPIESITIEQLADIYGENGKVTKWSEIGVDMGDNDEIVRVSRQNNSGTYVYFQEAVLGRNRDFRLGSRDMHGSKDVVELVENVGRICHADPKHDRLGKVVGEEVQQGRERRSQVDAVGAGIL